MRFILYKMEWINLALVIVLPLAVLGLGWLSFRLRQQVSEAEHKINALETLVKSLASEQRKVDTQFRELHSANTAFMAELERQGELTEQALIAQSQIQSQDPDSKLYTRAVKLVELGADLDEVMKECELPKAEAELLLSLRQKMHD